MQCPYWFTGTTLRSVRVQEQHTVPLRRNFSWLLVVPLLFRRRRQLLLAKQGNETFCRLCYPKKLPKLPNSYSVLEPQLQSRQSKRDAYRVGERAREIHRAQRQHVCLVYVLYDYRPFWVFFTNIPPNDKQDEP